MKNKKYRFDERDVFIRGKSILLKVLNEEDVINSNWYGWFNNEETTKNIQKHYYPNSMEEQIQFLRNNIKGSATKIQLGIYLLKAPEKLLGCVSLDDIDYINRKANISVIIGEKEGRNVKIYIETCQLIIQHAFKTLNLRRIYAGTIIKEIADLMCRGIGFKIEGIKRQDIYKDGRYHNVYMVGLLADDFYDKKV